MTGTRSWRTAAALMVALAVLLPMLSRQSGAVFTDLVDNPGSMISMKDFCAPGGSQRLDPLRDVTIDSGQATTNLAGVQTNAVQSGTRTRQTLMQWGVPTVPAKCVVTATMTMVPFEVTLVPAQPQVQISALTSAFVFDTVTWNTRPTSIAPSSVATVVAVGQPVVWDVSAIVNAWLDGSLVNHGLLVSAPASVTTGLQQFTPRLETGQPFIDVTW